VSRPFVLSGRPRPEEDRFRPTPTGAASGDGRRGRGGPGGVVDRLLIIDKPEGLTSHDVVERVRRSSGARKVGHAGTLDPSATGVLVVLVGRTTRLAHFLFGEEKEYRGSMLLGVRTDTDDREGRVVERADASFVRRADVEAVFARFVGTIQQIPPMVSAIKRNGTPLYVLARKGIVVDREPRKVVVKRLRLGRFEPPRAEFDIVCSSGTYVRTLAADVGAALGCGAHLASLARVRVGRFRIEDAVSLEEVEARRADLGALGCSMLEALAPAPVLLATPDETRALSLGTAIVVGPERLPEELPNLVRVTPDGVLLLAVAEVVREGVGDRCAPVLLQPIRVFAQES